VRLLIVVIIKSTDEEISPSLHYRTNLINTNTLSDVNLMMTGVGRNMQLSSSNKHHQIKLLCYWLNTCTYLFIHTAGMAHFRISEYCAFVGYML